MKMPFTVEQFLGVFETYNFAIWPAQVFAYVLGGLVLLCAIKKTKYSDTIITVVFSLLWIWIGIAFFIIFFSPTNKAAYLFGALFILQGLMILWFGVLSPRLSFHFYPGIISFVGAIIILYAMVIYPLIGYSLGHVYPQSPVFGVAPCPTVMFFLGLLLWSDKKIPLSILVIPVFWSLIGFRAVLFLGMKEDIGLLIAGILGAVLVTVGNRSKPAFAKSDPSRG